MKDNIKWLIQISLVIFCLFPLILLFVLFQAIGGIGDALEYLVDDLADRIWQRGEYTKPNP